MIYVTFDTIYTRLKRAELHLARANCGSDPVEQGLAELEYGEAVNSIARYNADPSGELDRLNNAFIKRACENYRLAAAEWKARAEAAEKWISNATCIAETALGIDPEFRSRTYVQLADRVKFLENAVKQLLDCPG